MNRMAHEGHHCPYTGGPSPEVAWPSCICLLLAMVHEIVMLFACDKSHSHTVLMAHGACRVLAVTTGM